MMDARGMASAGGSAVKPEQALFAVNQWLEWEASSLRPATCSGDAAAALAELGAALEGRQSLVGSGPTLADVSWPSQHPFGHLLTLSMACETAHMAYPPNWRVLHRW